MWRFLKFRRFYFSTSRSHQRMIPYAVSYFGSALIFTAVLYSPWILSVFLMIFHWSFFPSLFRTFKYILHIARYGGMNSWMIHISCISRHDMNCGCYPSIFYYNLPLNQLCQPEKHWLMLGNITSMDLTKWN